MLKYDDVIAMLMLEFPSFSFEDDEWELPYVVAEHFAGFVLEAYNVQDEELYKKGLAFVETLHLSNVASVKELATAGFLKSIQKTWPEELLKKGIPYEDLGIETKRRWDTLDELLG